MLYLYSFDQFAGFDRVFAYQWEEKLAIWDLVSVGDNLFLVLWKKIAFPELYTTLFVQVGSFSVVEKSFFSEKYIELLHWMVYYWYSNYKTVIKLFFEWDTPSLLQRKGKINKKTKKTEVSIGKQQIVAENSQILVVFPDLWTRENYLQADKDALLLNSLDTLVRKQTNRRKIKQSLSGIIIATGSEIFQDFQNLSDIFFVEPQKWYYASQQDPRYKVWTVLEKMSELRGAKITEISSEML